MNSYENCGTVSLFSYNSFDMNDILASVCLNDLSNRLPFVVASNDLLIEM